MAKATVKLKIKGDITSVKKAINKLAGKDSYPLREGDYRARIAGKK